MSVFFASRNRYPLGQPTRRAVPRQLPPPRLSPTDRAPAQVPGRAAAQVPGRAPNPIPNQGTAKATAPGTDSAAYRPPARPFAGGRRVAQRLQQQLGPRWHVVTALPADVAINGRKQAGFLAIGPGGVYAISVVDQGRQRVMMAGDVIQIKGDRPAYVADARRYAKKVQSALTDAVGTTVPVVAVLTFLGSGPISAQGLPAGCLVVSHRELDRLLTASGDKIAVDTAKKLAEVATHPATWADNYRWYPGGQTATGPGDKSATRR